jgi:hypothetical protein
MAYYNGARTHLSLEKDAPVPRAVQAIGRILPTSILEQYGLVWLGDSGGFHFGHGTGAAV